MLRVLICFLLSMAVIVGCGRKDIKGPKFDLCVFPESFKQAVEKKLKKECRRVEPEDLAQIKKLKANNMTSVKPGLLDAKYGAHFTSLEDLDISNSPNMSDIPEFIFYMPKLKQLNISHTGVSNFSGKMCQLQTLTTLTASNNSYEGKEIPIATFCLFSLQKLDMASSGIRYIDEYIYYLKNLKELYLKDNNLMILPVVTRVMLPTLSVLDLRSNDFENESVNSLHDCAKLAENSDEEKKCQNEMLDTVGCEYWHEMPFERGKQSFRDRFKEMTGEPFKHSDECVECNEYYQFWLEKYVFYGTPDDPKPDPDPNQESEYLEQKYRYILDLTINGKTIREWRVAYDELYKLGWRDSSLRACQLYIGGISWEHHGIIDSTQRLLFGPIEHDHAPYSNEIHMERYRAPVWERPEDCTECDIIVEGDPEPTHCKEVQKQDKYYCKPIRYNTPLPDYNMGSWSEALTIIQKKIDQVYPISTIGCENWPTSECPDWRSDGEKILEILSQ